MRAGKCKKKFRRSVYIFRENILSKNQRGHDAEK